MNEHLPFAIRCAGIGHFGVLVASSLVPTRLNWKDSLRDLPPLLRQLFWIYGGYIVLSIVGLGVVCLRYPSELAAGSPLARAVCTYAAIFWGLRLSLQPFLHARPYLTTWWLRGGYHLLTVLFAGITLTLGWAAMH